MLEAIAQAREAIAVEQYLVESSRLMNRFIAAMDAAVCRGVRVYMLLDDYGSRGLHQGDRQRLLDAGVALAFFNPLQMRKGYFNLARDHRKLLWVDGERAFVGGYGFTDHYLAESASWHDVALEVQGPCLADWRQAFLRTWRWTCDTAIELPLPAASAGGEWGRVSTNGMGGRGGVRRSLLQHMRRARERLWLTTAYFAPTRRLRRELRRAACRGVDVRLMLPGPISDHPGVSHAARRFYGILLRAGVRIFEYQPRFLHGKYLICDDWVAVGSCNYDHWTLRWNLEGNQEARDHKLAAQLVDLFERDMPDCMEMQLAAWRCRPWHLHIRERFWGWVEAWLNRRSYRQRIRRMSRRHSKSSQ